MRNLTKESRLSSRAYQFTKLIEAGYLQETYKGLDFFTIDEGKYFTLKVFWGTSANHKEYVNYRTSERRAEVIQNYKDNWDRHEKYKAEQKAKGYTSQHAGAAAAIKAELKAAFPGIKFSVTSDSFSMGDSVHITWTDGPTSEDVKAISGKYQYGHFNGMEDIYENTNSRDDIPQAKYVHTSRSKSPEVEALKTQLETYIHPDDRNDYRNNAESLLYRIFARTSLPAGAIITGIEKSGVTCGSYEDFFTITYTAPDQPTQPEQTNIEPVQTKAGEITVIEYGKGIAVLGEETRKIKDKLGRNGLGGIFQPRLSCGPGWIFPKSKLEAITQLLKEYTGQDVKEEEQTTEQPEETQILPTPENNTLQLDYFKIIWHEGRHIEGATFENAIFNTWEEVQKVFTILWNVNEKGSGGGYTKVKCEMKLKDQEPQIFRVDITDKVNNGDFNPSFQHIADYLQEDEDNATEHGETMRNALLY